MSRCKDIWWDVGENPSWERAKLATLMDLRDELRELNRRMGRAGALLHSIHRASMMKPRRISKRQAARVLAKAGARKRRKP